MHLIFILWHQSDLPECHWLGLLPLALHLHLAGLRGVGAAAEAGQGTTHHAHLAVVFPQHLGVAGGLSLLPTPMDPDNVT